MINEYNLRSHSWLNGIYRLWHKWATTLNNHNFGKLTTTFSNHKFSVGLLATSISKGTNSILKKAGNETISFYDFVLNYKKFKIIGAQKKTKSGVDTHYQLGKPSIIMKNNSVLNHVVDLYTLDIYILFQLELINFFNTKFVEQPWNFSNPLLSFK